MSEYEYIMIITTEEVNMSTICPNCGAILEKEVKKKTKCPHCSKYIYIRTGKTLSEYDAFIDSWLGGLEYLVPSNGTKYVQTIQSQLQQKFNKKPSSKDLVWGVFNSLVTKLLNDPEKLSYLYENMARFQQSFDNNKYAIQLRNTATKFKMKSYENMGYTGIQIMAYEDDCKKCKSRDGEVISIIEAQKHPDLLFNHCNNDECRFDFVPSEYDINNSIKPTKTSGELEPNINGDYTCPYCGSNMGKVQEKKHLFSAPDRYLHCSSCNAHLNVHS